MSKFKYCTPYEFAQLSKIAESVRTNHSKAVLTVELLNERGHVIAFSMLFAIDGEQIYKALNQ